MIFLGAGKVKRYETESVSGILSSVVFALVRCGILCSTLAACCQSKDGGGSTAESANCVPCMMMKQPELDVTLLNRPLYSEEEFHVSGKANTHNGV
jgi:hypothetical protein